MTIIKSRPVPALDDRLPPVFVEHLTRQPSELASIWSKKARHHPS